MEDVDAIARETGKSRSELVCDALRRYTATERWRLLRHGGFEKANAAGVGATDVEDLIDGLRESEEACRASPGTVDE